ncbi:MAG: DUF3387 domain-containing protein [Patescibacteria group bacterium]|nr:DUF3387 domain-containing protein [Patescibacteria group bacterium]
MRLNYSIGYDTLQRVQNDLNKHVAGNLTDDELAFYDALANNESAREVLGDKQLAVIAIEVFRSIKGNATIDWTLKESVRARLRRDVKRILNRYGYPPDQQLIATENVLKQAELIADELTK